MGRKRRHPKGENPIERMADAMEAAVREILPTADEEKRADSISRIMSAAGCANVQWLDVKELRELRTKAELWSKLNPIHEQTLQRVEQLQSVVVKVVREDDRDRRRVLAEQNQVEVGRPCPTCNHWDEDPDSEWDRDEYT